MRFSHAIATAGATHATFIEISPHPLLTHAITDTLGSTHHHSLATLLRDTHDTLTFHTHLNTTHTTHPPHTDHPPEPHPSLPTTPWHHTHHWITTRDRGNATGSAPRAGTLLGEHVTVSSTPAAHLWQARLVPEAKPYPGHHRLHGVEVVPVSVLLQTMLTAAAELGACALSDVRFEHPIVVDRPKVIQVVADHESVSVASSSAADAPGDRWTRHATAQLSPFVDDPEATYPADQTGHETVNGAAPSVDEQLRARGVRGSAVSLVRRFVHTNIDRPGRSRRPDRSVHGGATRRRSPHRAARGCRRLPARMYPQSVEHVRLDGALTERHGSVSVRRSRSGADEVIVDIAVAAGNGDPCIALRSLRYAALEPLDAADADPRSFAHTIEWQPREDRVGGQMAGSGTIAVIGAETRATDDLRKRLEDAGCVPGELADARYVLYIADAEPAEGAEADIDCAARMSAQVTSLVRLLAERDEHHPVTLWIATTGVHEAAQPAAVRQSCLWGLAGVISVEHPEIWGGLVDLAATHDVGETAGALSGVLGAPSKTVLVLRDGVFHAPELVPVTGEPVREALRCRPDAAYLITGGLGALGLLMAGWLADRGARRLLLAGRTPLPPQAGLGREHRRRRSSPEDHRDPGTGKARRFRRGGHPRYRIGRRRGGPARRARSRRRTADPRGHPRRRRHRQPTGDVEHGRFDPARSCGRKSPAHRHCTRRSRAAASTSSS